MSLQEQLGLHESFVKRHKAFPSNASLPCDLSGEVGRSVAASLSFEPKLHWETIAVNVVNSERQMSPVVRADVPVMKPTRQLNIKGQKMRNIGLVDGV